MLCAGVRLYAAEATLDPREGRRANRSPTSTSRQEWRVALVTGGNRGIGYEICRALGALGMRGVLIARDPARGAEAVERIRAEGNDVVFGSAVIDRQVLSPPDLERRFGLTGGNTFQGAMTPSQLFFLRPVPGYADYRTPIRGPYLCGAATHPGGGVMGASGYNAAREILRDG